MFHHEIYPPGHPTLFEPFVSYLLKRPKDMQFRNDIHWRPINEICHPCQINYDFIGNYETLEDDLAEVSNLLNMKIKFPRTRKNRIYWKDSFKPIMKLHPDYRERLTNHYFHDLKMFNYTYD
ncbi:unnamed protein product [Dimorphilus gyrociliatus]|uniref:Carbohydrate sulfotransferase n=1 Tax=Dimorphilus gyrociliatus TaxID=2664684 RepID=A0A7I8VIT0_9ANNE|nr:unnamed protein product [Dimorphilus gyrociliatus]